MTLFIVLSFLLYFMCMTVLHVCVCISSMCVPGALGGEQSVSDPLDLELLMVMNYYVGAENWT